MNPRLKMRGYSVAAIAVLTGTVAWLMIQQPIQQDETAKANTTASQALDAAAEVQKQVDANASALADANRRLVALGKAPVPVPPAPPQAPPVQQDEFTAAEAAAVRAIVADQIEADSLTQAEITQIAKAAAALIPKPADGKSPTPAQLETSVKVAVAAYCLEGRCQGKPGDKGDQGPKVTDEELLAAAQTTLAAYCAQDDKPCKGETGEPGATVTGSPGAEGKQGRGVADMDCQADGTWRISYSDGTTSTSRGPCRAVVLPTN